MIIKAEITYIRSPVAFMVALVIDLIVRTCAISLLFVSAYVLTTSLELLLLVPKWLWNRYHHTENGALVRRSDRPTVYTGFLAWFWTGVPAVISRDSGWTIYYRFSSAWFYSGQTVTDANNALPFSIRDTTGSVAVPIRNGYSSKRATYASPCLCVETCREQDDRDGSSVDQVDTETRVRGPWLRASDDDSQDVQTRLQQEILVKHLQYDGQWVVDNTLESFTVARRHLEHDIDNINKDIHHIGPAPVMPLQNTQHHSKIASRNLPAWPIQPSKLQNLRRKPTAASNSRLPRYTKHRSASLTSAPLSDC